MAQTNLTIRIDEDVKRDAEALFDKLGLTMSGAINVFVRQAIRERGLPFIISEQSREEKYNDYFNRYNMKILAESVAQAQRGETVNFSLSELNAMENGKISSKATEFLEAGGDAGSKKNG